MSWYSINGTGATIHSIERTPEGRVLFTVWLSVLWIPFVPISSWSAVYAGEVPPNGLTYEGHYFADLVRIRHVWHRLVRTFVRSLIFAVIACAPAAFLIAHTHGRAATNVEMVFVFASAAWPVVLIILSERVRRRQLKGP